MILLSPEAALDIERLRDFLEEKSPNAAKRALSALWVGVEKLQDFPALGAPTQDVEVRQLVIRFSSSAYVVRYTELPASKDILVLRIWHGREAQW